MPPVVMSELRSVGLATLAASTVASLALALEYLPRWLSPSSPPSTPTDAVTRLLVLALMSSILRAMWLLPACTVGRWVMSRRGDYSMAAASWAGLAVSALAIATVLLLPGVLEQPSAGYWPNKIPAVIQCALFVATWFAVVALLAPPTVVKNPIGSVARRAAATALATLAILAALGWTVFLGLIGSMFMGDQGSHHLVSTVASPQGSTRAYLVSYHTPGGGLGHTEHEIYVLRSSEAWTPGRRGLLVWKARRGDVLGVEWTSERNIRVQVGTQALRPRGYSRDGFTTQTVDDAGRPVS